MFFLARLLWRGFPIIQETIRKIMRGWRDAFRLNMYQQPLQNPSCKPISKQLHRGKTLYWRHLSSSYWQSLFYNDWQRATAKHRFYFRAVKHLLTRVLSVKSGIDQTFCFFSPVTYFVLNRNQEEFLLPLFNNQKQTEEQQMALVYRPLVCRGCSKQLIERYSSKGKNNINGLRSKIILLPIYTSERSYGGTPLSFRGRRWKPPSHCAVNPNKGHNIV